MEGSEGSLLQPDVGLRQDFQDVGYVYDLQWWIFEVMSFVERDSALWKELSLLAADEDLLLYDAERFAGKGLRVVIARSAPSAESGEPARRENVTSNDCTRFCRRLMVFFAAEGANFGLRPEPEIEVASPGVNRALRIPEHFEGAVGERIKVIWQQSPDAAPTQTTIGVLQEVAGDQLSMLDEQTGEPQSVVLERVRKAHVDFQF